MSNGKCFPCWDISGLCSMSRSFSGVPCLPPLDPFHQRTPGHHSVLIVVPQQRSPVVPGFFLPHARSCRFPALRGAGRVAPIPSPSVLTSLPECGIPALTCGSAPTAGSPPLSSSPPSPPHPLCSLWIRKQSLWQVKEVPALPGGGPAGLHLIMAAPPHPSPLSLLL